MTTAFREVLETTTSDRRERHWLVSLREDARRRYEAVGLPTPRDEDWKFTSVTPIAQATFQSAPAVSLDQAHLSTLQPYRLAGMAAELVLVNGVPTGEMPQLPGVEVAPLSSLADDARLEQYLGTLAGAGGNGFTALNTALFAECLVIRVKPGARLDQPLHLLHYALSGEQPGVSHPRVLVIAGQSAEIPVVESFVGASDSGYFTNAVTEVFVGANARVEHIKLQRESERAFHVATVEARQERDSGFRSFSLALGGALTRTNIYSVMQGPGSNCTMNGLYLLHGTQHTDHQTRIEHAEPNCSSREVYKGVLDGQSHGVFNGKVYVRPEAQKTDGKQTNNNLLLSDGAKIDTKPQLEIFADDVKCTHGATVGRLDEVALFYLESRGISRPAARRLLTYGFAAEVLEAIRQDQLRQRLEQVVFERLEAPTGY